MHLAAAAGVPCVAVFVECRKPGVWFPYGSGHKVICHGTNGLSRAAVSVDEVFEAARQMAEEKR